MWYLRPTVSGALSSIQQTWASMSWATGGALCGRHSMSPRLRSMSSVSRIVTDIGG